MSRRMTKRGVDGTINLHAVLSLEAVAAIAFCRGLIPSPSKQNVANVERRALRKMREAILYGGSDECPDGEPELVAWLEDHDGGIGQWREEQRGRHMAAAGR